MHTIGARWLFDGLGELHENVLLAWEGEYIVAVQPGRGFDAEQYFNRALILPGLVNAHTHLDLSDMRADKLPREPCAWLSHIIEHRRQATPETQLQAARRGIHELLRHGVTLVGDIVASSSTLSALAESPLRATAFLEILGLTKSRARQSWHWAGDLLQNWSRSPRCHPALSPHSPYSTRRSLFRLASRSGLLLAIHVAEFVEEHTLLEKYSGTFRAWLESLRVWDGKALVSGYAELLSLLAPAKKVLFIHLNYPTNALLDTLTAWSAKGRVGVVYCPRTHAFFAHSRHPWAELLERGIPVILGTDSRASNPDLNLLEELRWVWRQGCPLSAAQLLRLATSQAARLLGWPQTGSLLPGQCADFLVFSLPPDDATDPLHLLLETNICPAQVYIGGQLVHATD